MAGVLNLVLRAGRKVVDKIEGLIDAIADDTLVQRGLEADLGLPPGALDKAKPKRPDLAGIEEYISAVDPDAEKLAVAFDSIKAYAKFWTTVFDAARTEDPAIVADELLYRLLEYATVELIKYEHPRGYAVMRLLRVIRQDAMVTLEETLAPEVPANLFEREYWEALPHALKRGYNNFRLDQAPDFSLDDPSGTVDDEERTRLRQLGFRVFGYSDLGLLGLGTLVWLSRPVLEARGLEIEHFYGWELPSPPKPPLCLEPPAGTGIPISDHIASRGYTMRVRPAGEAAATPSGTLTQFLLEGEDGRLGWLLSLRGAVTFEEKTAARRIKLKMHAPEGLDALIRFTGDDRFSFTGAPGAGMGIAVEPADPSSLAPALALPDVWGGRLELGQFALSFDIAPDGFKLKAAARKSALVIVGAEADPLVEESLGSRETRIDFDLSLVADANGISAEGGGKLAVTIPVNRRLLGIRVESVQLALTPAASEAGSELRFEAVTSFGLDRGPVRFRVEQIGMTLDVGTSRNPAPPDALPVLGPCLYVHNAGFRAPSGLGVQIRSDLVNGGGFLFFDRDKQQYAGVLQLELGSWGTFTAIGLLTTRLPDGTRGYSFLIIASLQFTPPLNAGIFQLGGLGGVFGLRRALDTDVLRAGMRGGTLDAILFPEDPVADAPRLLAALGPVFPPAADRHVAGPILRLSWGTPPVITAEVALLFEWGAGARRALLGQLHAAYPAKKEKKLLQLKLDGAGLCVPERDEFSLDARLYDSHIAFVTLSGEAALRQRGGDDRFFLFSAGGYHPEFAAPAHFPQLERLKIKLVDREDLRLILTGYVALTSNTRQIGAEMDFFGAFKGFSIEARISFDALWEADVRFLLDFDIEARIKYKGMTLLGVSVSGRCSGPEPKRMQGEWSIDLWLVSISKSFDCIQGSDRPRAALPAVDPLPAVVAALADPRSWSAPLPAGGRALVTFSARAAADEVLVHPLAALEVRQQVLPLGIELDRFGGGVLGGQRSFAITNAALGGRAVAQLRPVEDFFAAAEFLDLSDDDKLRRPSFERMPAGVTLQAEPVAFGGQAPGTAHHAAVSEMDFEDVPGGVRPLHPALAAAAAGFGPAARSPLRADGVARFAAPGPRMRVGAERFAVAGVDDLTPVPVDGTGPAGQASHAAALQALERHLQANPAARGRLQVVPAFRAEAPS